MSPSEAMGGGWPDPPRRKEDDVVLLAEPLRPARAECESLSGPVHRKRNPVGNDSMLGQRRAGPLRDFCLVARSPLSRRGCDGDGHGGGVAAAGLVGEAGSAHLNPLNAKLLREVRYCGRTSVRVLDQSGPPEEPP